MLYKNVNGSKMYRKLLRSKHSKDMSNCRGNCLLKLSLNAKKVESVKEVDKKVFEKDSFCWW